MENKNQKPYGWACAIRDKMANDKKPSIGETIKHYWGKLFK